MFHNHIYSYSIDQNKSGGHAQRPWDGDVYLSHREALQVALQLAEIYNALRGRAVGTGNKNEISHNFSKK